MTDGEVDGTATNRPHRVGERLRATREEQGLTLDDVAQRTRIPLRHLAAIETASFETLPSITYAMGFARAYARTVGADEAAIARDLRAELGQNYQRPEPRPMYDPADTARVPPSGLAIAGVIVALLIVIGVGIWYGSGMFGGDDGAPTAADAPATIETPSPAAAPSPAPAPATGGQVTLTATDEVWVRVYDSDDNTLLLKTMAAGERFDVPADADSPMINIGRPDQLRITINGSDVPPLGDGSRALSDVPIDAESLRTRGAAGDSAPPA